MEEFKLNETPWKTDNWFTSPWNFFDEVRAGLNFSENIKIHDITLRDGEQQTGITFTRPEKVEIAQLLAKAGVHRIEAGMPVVSPSDEAGREGSRGGHQGDCGSGSGPGDLRFFALHGSGCAKGRPVRCQRHCG